MDETKEGEGDGAKVAVVFDVDNCDMGKNGGEGGGEDAGRRGF
jgi:hypothetical protein